MSPRKNKIAHRRNQCLTKTDSVLDRAKISMNARAAIEAVRRYPFSFEWNRSQELRDSFDLLHWAQDQNPGLTTIEANVCKRSWLREMSASIHHPRYSPQCIINCDYYYHWIFAFERTAICLESKLPANWINYTFPRYIMASNRGT
jgi:hypothetical protein